MTARGLVDAAGVRHRPVADGGARIVCLVPSITELLCDLGLVRQIVGRTGFCIHPRELVGSITKVGGTKDVKVDRIRELQPTHVVVNVDENRIETVRELSAFVPSVIVTHPLGPLDNLELYRLLGGIFGREAEAGQLEHAFRVELERLQSTSRPQRDVLYLIWRDPWMTVSPDTYISRLLALASWRTVPQVANDRYPVVDPVAFSGIVDRVLLSSEPYRFRDKHIPEVAALVPGAEVSLIDSEMHAGTAAARSRAFRTSASWRERCDRAGTCSGGAGRRGCRRRVAVHRRLRDRPGGRALSRLQPDTDRDRSMAPVLATGTQADHAGAGCKSRHSRSIGVTDLGRAGCRDLGSG